MLVNPDYLRDRPSMSVDPFSDILTFADAQSVMSGGLVAGGAWAIRFPPPDKIKLFVIVRGACWLAIDGEEAPHRVDAGDVFLLAAPRRFVLASDLAAEPADSRSGFFDRVDGIARHGDGDEFSLLGGHVKLDPARGALLFDVLTPLIHMHAGSAE